MILSDRDQRLICLWLAGWKTESIAAEIGISYTRVRTRALKVGLPKRKVRGLNLWPSIVAWARNGYDAEDIAKGIKCTRIDVMSGCGSLGVVSRETKRRKRSTIVSRSKASKRSWATRKRQAAARRAA